MTCALEGVTYGSLLHKKQSQVRIIIAVGIVQLVLGLLVNTYWISILYGSPFVPLLATRAVQCIVMIPVEFIVIGAMSKVVARQKGSILQ